MPGQFPSTPPIPIRSWPKDSQAQNSLTSDRNRVGWWAALFLAGLGAIVLIGWLA